MTAKNTVELLKQVSKLMSNGGFDSVLKNVRYQSISITTLKGVNFDKKKIFKFQIDRFKLLVDPLVIV